VLPPPAPQTGEFAVLERIDADPANDSWAGVDSSARPATTLFAHIRTRVGRFHWGLNQGPWDQPSLTVEWATRQIAAGTKMSALDRITVDPAVCGGRPCIRGLRIRVKDVLDLLAAGATHSEILADYPYLEPDDITAVLAFAARQNDHPVLRSA